MRVGEHDMKADVISNKDGEIIFKVRAPDGMETTVTMEAAENSIDVQGAAPGQEIGGDQERLKVFKGEEAKIRFQYRRNDSGGKEVWDAYLPGFNENKWDDAALDNWGVTQEQINQGFIGERLTSPPTSGDMTTRDFVQGAEFNPESNQATEHLVGQMARLEGFSTLLKEMEDQNLSNTEEYRILFDKVAIETGSIQRQLGEIGINAERDT